MKKPKDLISDAWRKISSENTLYSDQWLCDETWFRVIKRQYPSLQNAIIFNRGVLNRVLSPLAGSYDQSNIEGIYHATFRTICPYDGQRRCVSYYFRQVHGAPPSSPMAPSDVQDVIAKTVSMQKNRARISALEKEKCKSDDVAKSINDLQDEAKRNNAIENNEAGGGTQPSSNIANESDSNTSQPSSDIADEAASNTSSASGNLTSGGHVVAGGQPSDNSEGRSANDKLRELYWQSTEAKKLFGFMNDDDVDVVEALNERICLLQKVNETEHGYKLVIPMTEDSSCLSTHNIFTIRNKSLFLIRAYQIALEEMKVGVQWSRDCCQPAVDELNNLGIKTTESAKTVGEWNQAF